jgi:hypothetical protein
VKTILAITLSAALVGGLSAQDCKKACEAVKTSVTQDKKAKSGCCQEKAKASLTQDAKAKGGCCDEAKAKTSVTQDKAKGGCCDEAKAKTSVTQDKAKAGCCDQAKAKASLTAEQCSSASKNTVIAKFKTLKPEQQKEVAKALVSLCKTCPMGSKIPGTITSLNRLYGEALVSLNKVAKAKHVSGEMKKDLQKQIALVTNLSDLNKANCVTFKTIAASLGEKECGEGCAASCCAEEQGCSITSATKMTKAWGGAQKEVADCMKCETTTAKMKADMSVFKKYGIDLQTLTTKNFIAQQKLLDKECGQLACSKGGIMARHSEVMNACSWTNENTSKSVKAVATAHKLLKATPFMAHAKKTAPKKTKTTSKTSNTGECPASSCDSKGKGECRR